MMLLMVLYFVYFLFIVAEHAKEKFLAISAFQFAVALIVLASLHLLLLGAFELIWSILKHLKWLSLKKLVKPYWAKLVAF